MLPRALLAASSMLLLGAAPALAGDAIMPLAEVQPGMRCTALSVLRGTEISSFDAEVLAVVAGDPEAPGPRILVRTSGPAIDATGIGPGFSGSPVYCPDASGQFRNAGALSEGIGEFGNKVVLATPIETLLGERPDPPRGARPNPGLTRRARSLAALNVSGLSTRVARALSASAKKAGRTVFQAPAAPAASFPPQELRPGAAASASMTSGDVAIGSIGTVAYEDAGRVWLFGHPLDAAGARSLILQDTFVFSVINNPVGIEMATTYKLAAAGHDVGVVTNDAPFGAVGKVGNPAPTIPMQVIARDLDSGRIRTTRVRVADEAALGNPVGASGLNLAGSLILAEAATSVLQGAPSKLSARMCMRITLRELRTPVRVCNNYVAASEPGGEIPALADLAVQDFIAAISPIDAYAFKPLHVADVAVTVKVRRGLLQSFLIGGSATAARPGGRTRVTIRLRDAGGGRRTLRRSFRVPRAAKPGARNVILSGTPADVSADGEGGEDGTIFLDVLAEEKDPGEDRGDPGPRSPAEVAAKIDEIKRFDGVRAAVTGTGERGGSEVAAFRARGIRLSGKVEIPLRIRRR